MDTKILKESRLLTGKSVLITGGTTGIGRATAVLLASKGASIFIFGRHEKELNDAINDIRKSGGDAYGCTADVANYEDVVRVFEEFDDQLGSLDILINNASIAARSSLNSRYDDWLYLFKVNVLGYILCARFAYDRMKKNRSGHIINIGSMSTYTQDADTDLYVAAKSAIAGFNGSIRKKIEDDNIKVTIIEPGSVGTDLIGETTHVQKELESTGKMLKAEDIAECIYYCLTQPERVEIIRVQIKSIFQNF